ncbi:aldehyde dehydrogenase family protein [Oceanicola sp. 502str15]|uniref:aldehyde dehydrogenase family protein n=1 Tax=Oceanicola sp. 502str15 TaxID=2696061 RepID=UPI002095042A|nr:aldehyde dehydrogenase family protein [Oceanicola sp. 502str15]MCO6382923.1 aldehyde dehydrogenase family protein [Oceanicola sp. 502str15]
MTDLHQLLDTQRSAFLAAPPPELATRRADLSRLAKAVSARADALAAAANEDFGRRASDETKLIDLVPAINTITYLDRHLRRFMAPERRRVHPALWPGKARVHYQPKGVVGIVSPWNYPFLLALAPLATALAAGNRVMLKPSEFTPACNAALRALLEDLFRPDQVAVVEGGPEVGAAFSGLPFDHLFFTGGTEVGRKVMQAASANLTPVTLELGGKSPAVIAPGADMAQACGAIAFGKLVNGGQTCIAPDYALVPRGEVEAFCAGMRSAAQALYPEGLNDPNFTLPIHSRHADRLAALAEKAEGQGARRLPLFEGENAPALLLEVTEEMEVMQEEIFGPLLPVVPYDGIEEAIAHINARPRPLALYHFGPDDAAREAVLTRTTSGGVTVNDTLLHIAVDDMPFGGIGASGIGAYHGPEGFRTMSHAKSVFTQRRPNGAHLIRPPYGKWTRRILGHFLN